MKYFVDTPQQDRYVLKALPPYASSLPFCKAVLRYQQGLAEQGLPLPAFVPTLADGQRYHHVTYQGGQRRIFTLQQLASGGAVDTQQAVTSAMRLLRRLHVDGCALVDCMLPRETVFDCVLRLFQIGPSEMAAKHPKEWPGVSRNILDMLGKYRRHILFSRDKALHKGYLSHVQPVHGDFHFNNLLFLPSGTVSAVLDFDDAKLDNPIQDLARFAASLGIFRFHEHPDRQFSQIPQYVDVALLRSIVQAYFEREPGEGISYFIPVLKCIALQMAFIGLLSGSYDFSQIKELARLPDMLDAQLGESI